jgi:hypothetical protein
MPYKDINKRREVIRKSVARWRARKKSITINNEVNPKSKEFSEFKKRQPFFYLESHLSEINKTLQEWKKEWKSFRENATNVFYVRKISKVKKDVKEEIIKNKLVDYTKKKISVPLSQESKQLLLIKIAEWEEKTGIKKDSFPYRIWRNQVKMKALRQVPEYQERERIRGQKRRKNAIKTN